MLKNKLLAVVLVFAGFTPAFADGGCKAPDKPKLPPNGATITYDQLNTAANLVKAYAKANLSYKQCLDGIITKPENYSRDKWRSALQAYNQSVPTENAIWGQYEKLSKDWISANQASKR